MILCADRGFYGGGYYGDRDMRKLTEETGGRVIDAGNHPEKLRDAFASSPSSCETNTRSDTRQPIRQRMAVSESRDSGSKAKDAKIQARKGYYAPRA